MIRPHMFLGCVVVAVVGRESLAQATFRRADLDAQGRLRLTTSTGRIVLPPKDSEQVGFEQVAISPDHRAVGWVALYPNCCTTYPVPLKLIILTAGRADTLVGTGLPIWRWAFVADGRRVAFRQAPVHGSPSSHYELHEVSTGRLVSTFDPPSDTVRDAPAWARALERSPPPPNER